MDKVREGSRWRVYLRTPHEHVVEMDIPTAADEFEATQPKPSKVRK